MSKIFISNNPEDLEIYFKRAYRALKKLNELVLNLKDRDLDTGEVIEAAYCYQIIVCLRSTHGKAAILKNLPELTVFLRPQVGISDIDVAAVSTNSNFVANSMPAFIPATPEMFLTLMLDLTIFVTRPISQLFLVLAVFSLI